MRSAAKAGRRTIASTSPTRRGGNTFLAGANFENGRVIKWEYVTTPPRPLACFCAHRLTHIVVAEHLGGPPPGRR